MHSVGNNLFIFTCADSGQSALWKVDLTTRMSHQVATSNYLPQACQIIQSTATGYENQLLLLMHLLSGEVVIDRFDIATQQLSNVGLVFEGERRVEVTKWDGTRANKSVPVEEVGTQVGSLATSSSFSLDNGTAFDITTSNNSGSYILVTPQYSYLMADTPSSSTMTLSFQVRIPFTFSNP